MQDFECRAASYENAAAQAHIDDLLDRALEDSFPASDPIAFARVD